MTQSDPFPSLPEYNILKELGSGGTANVYLAEHTVLHREEAIKVLKQHLAADPAAASRFLAEARTTALLSHPHIVPVYTVSSANLIQPYFTMQFIYGADLSEILRQLGRLEFRRLLPLLLQVSSALDFAHSKGVIHRDVKPSNILISQRDGIERAFVTDFGIAKSSANVGQTRMTQVGTFLGTPAYMSPESALGDELSALSDQYSLAVVAYEALLGFGPFKGDAESTPARLLVAHATSTPLHASEVDPTIPRAVGDVLARALSKTQNERFASCTAFVEALEDGFQRLVAASASDSPLTTLQAKLVERQVKPADTHIETNGAADAGEQPSVYRAETRAAVALGADDKKSKVRRGPILAAVGAVLGALGILLIVRAALPTNPSKPGQSQHIYRPDDPKDKPAPILQGAQNAEVTTSKEGLQENDGLSGSPVTSGVSQNTTGASNRRPVTRRKTPRQNQAKSRASQKAAQDAQRARIANEGKKEMREAERQFQREGKDLGSDPRKLSGN